MAIPEIVIEACLCHFGTAEVSLYSKEKFSYSWRVCGTSIKVFLSDYLNGAPNKVFDDFYNMVYRRTRNLKWTEPDSYLVLCVPISSSRPDAPYTSPGARTSSAPDARRSRISTTPSKSYWTPDGV